MQRVKEKVGGDGTKRPLAAGFVPNRIGLMPGDSLSLRNGLNQRGRPPSLPGFVVVFLNTVALYRDQGPLQRNLDATSPVMVFS